MPGEERKTAHAPYNFVPLPDRVVAAESIPDHDQYHADRRTGYFDVKLTTETPLYIRGMLTEREAAAREQHKNKPDFFQVGGKPIIPGSSLRGMLRALTEIVGFGKLSRRHLSDKRLFYRDLRAVHYRDRMTRTFDSISDGVNLKSPGYQMKARGGFLRQTKTGYWQIEECVIARVDTGDILKVFGLKRVEDLYLPDGKPVPGNQQQKGNRNPNLTPNPKYQHREIFLDVDQERDHFFPKKFNSKGNRLVHDDLYLRFRKGLNIGISAQHPGQEKGILVLTGRMQNKHLEFVFVPQKSPAIIQVPNDPSSEDINQRIIDRFNSDDQITQWQQEAFPADKGRLQNGDPVFFLTEDNNPDKLVFLGRAGMFRLPYKHSPADLLPEDHRDPRIYDFAEALFGFVREKGEQGTKAKAYAGRVTVSDAILSPGQTNLYEPTIKPPILSTPKPTTFQHYLMQPNGISTRKNDLHHYDSNGAKLRGHKLYWRRRIKKALDIPGAEQTDKLETTETQRTLIKPLRAGVKFTFRVYFENLTKVELGLLAWVLKLPGDESYRHMLGMGKPFGLGVVKLEPTLHLCNRAERYRTMLNTDNTGWATGYSAESTPLDDFITAFEQFLENQKIPDSKKRLDHLRAMLIWHEDNSRFFSYMQIEPDNEYKDRPVLRTPREELDALEGK